MAELDVEKLKALVARRDELEVGAPGWLTASLAVARHIDAKLIAALEDRDRLRAATVSLLDAIDRLPLNSWAEDHRPDCVDGCTICGWDDIRKCVSTASHDTQLAVMTFRAALEGRDG